MEQLLLFNESKSEFDGLWEAIESVKGSHNQVRKRLFAEIRDLKEEVNKLKAENERMKFHLEIKLVLRWTA